MTRLSVTVELSPDVAVSSTVSRYVGCLRLAVPDADLMLLAPSVELRRLARELAELAHRCDVHRVHHQDASRAP